MGMRGDARVLALRYQVFGGSVPGETLDRYGAYNRLSFICWGFLS